MAITTFAELEAALVDRIARQDYTSTVQAECIALAEAEMQRELDTLDMITTNTSFAIATEYVTTPTGLLEVRDFYLNLSPRRNLTPMAAAAITQLYGSATGIPKNYAIEGASFRFGPIPSASYTATLSYLAKFTPLTAIATTNWLLTAHPDVYLYGSLKHAAVRLLDANLAASYDTLFRAAMDSINRQARKVQNSGPGFAVKPA